jgi:SAM-dependent methyltransferase
MSNGARNIIEQQATEHPLEFSNEFATLEDYCLYLMHQRAYEEAAELVRGRKVLDFGCNNGYGTDFLKKYAESIVGVDVSSAALADAARRYPGLDVRLFDGVTLPFDSGSFDVVVSLQVIEHVPDTQRYLGEISRVLKPGGTAIFSTPNAAIRLDPGMTPWNRFHVREYRAHELHDDIARIFPQVKVRGLFAQAELYRVEYQRCQRALAMQRNPKPAPRQNPVRSVLVRILRAVLPAVIAQRLQQTVNGAPRPAEKITLDPTVKAKFSTRDLFYRDTDIDAAIDLMAVCQKN